MTKKRILVAPLDWGLGHATRCIPIIRYLQEKNCDVVIGADGRPLSLLKGEFPSCEFIIMPGANIFYPKNGSMVLKMAAQVPKILKGIKQEHALLEKIIAEQDINAVISDNRYGLWSKKIPCVFITHQLMVKSPLGENFIRKKSLEYISKFSECWIPDFENGLSGDLGNKFPLPENARYIGLLSRFTPSLKTEKAIRELLVILSGPEPQRTAFEKMIIEQSTLLNPTPKREDFKILIVQGITEKNDRKKISEHVEMVSHLTSEELQKEILSSEIILSRPGYSTIMDLAVIGKKAIFVPTPGQTEQEYLARELMKKKVAYSTDQKKFNLASAMKESEKYRGFKNFTNDDFRTALDDLLKKIT